MPLLLRGASSGTDADVTSDRNLRIESRAPAFGALGAYSVVATTGALAATLAAGAPIFSARWGDASRLCLIEYLNVSAIVSGAITTAVLWDLELAFARSFTASDTTGTSVTPAAGMNKRRTSMGNSLFTDVRIAGTAALTAGTRTLDTNGMGRVQGYTGTTVGTRVFDSAPVELFEAQSNQHPIILATNEGVVIRAPLAGPATGTLTVKVRMDWQEVAAY